MTQSLKLTVIALTPLFIIFTACDSKPSAAASPPGPAQSSVTAAATVYACPMHPDVTDTKPSRCPKCGMRLVASDAAAPK